ncbi:MAG: hypothetical protein WDO56_00480 [Gammaproteobacteria bacterium]
MIHGGGKRRNFRLIGGNVHSSAKATAHRDFLQLLSELTDRFQVTSLKPVENEQQGGHEPEEKAQQPQYRHLVFLKAPFESAFSPEHRPPELLLLVVSGTLCSQV